jgi:hypothetical protein
VEVERPVSSRRSAPVTLPFSRLASRSAAPIQLKGKNYKCTERQDWTSDEIVATPSWHRAAPAQFVATRWSKRHVVVRPYDRGQEAPRATALPTGRPEIEPLRLER